MIPRGHVDRTACTFAIYPRKSLCTEEGNFRVPVNVCSYEMNGTARLKTSIWLAVASLALALPAFGESATNWHDSFDAAREAATASEKPILAEFHSAGCGPCTRLEQETLADPQVMAFIGKHFEAVRVSGLLEPALATKYLVSFYPTVKFIDAGGKAVYDVQGFVPPADFVDVMNAALVSHTALQRARTAAASHDGSPEEALSIAKDFLQARQHSQAAEWAQKATEDASAEQRALVAEANYVLGAALTEAGEPGKARRPLVEALRHADGADWQWDARLKLGYVWLQRGEEDSGIGMLQTVHASDEAAVEIRSEAARLLRWWGVEVD